MGTRGYNVWTPDEEEALRRGVKKHGLGAWEVIRKDPEFSVLENRTGVQLKDKFRNLVKFRHITQEESRTLKPKGSGPWSRKHSASSFGRDGSLTPSANEIPGVAPAEEHDNAAEHAAALLALDSKAHGDTANSDPAAVNGNQLLALTSPPKARGPRGFESPSEDGDDGSLEQGLRRKRRRSLENRSFGIYDQRRYRSNGTLRTPGDDERTDTESDEPNGARPTRQRRSYNGSRTGSGRPMARGRTRTRRNVDEESEETTTDEEDYGTEEEAEEPEAMAEDDYVVDCPCGIRYDDGAMMVECEACKTWAHIDCLQYQATTNPASVSYDLNNYMCLICQSKRNPMAAAMVRASKASTGPPGKARLGNAAELNGILPDATGLALPPGLGGPLEGVDVGQMGARYSRDRTQEAGHVLLGLANGDPMPLDADGSNGAGLPRNASKQSLRRDASAGLSGLHPSLSSGILSAGALQTPAYLDSLSLFLAATARPSSALGHRSGNSPRSNPTSPSKLGGAGTRGARAASGSLAGAGSMDGSASQQNLEKLLAAATAPGGSLDGSSASALALSRSGLLGPHLTDAGRGSPNSLAMLRRAGSSTQPVPGVSGTGQTQHQPSTLGGAAAANGARPVSRGPVGAEIFGDSDDDLHHSAALAQLFSAQTTNDRLLQMLASTNRAATPSQIFLEQLMRGATPDINLAPLIQGAALQGAAAAAAAAAQAQLQILQQHGLGSAGHSLLPTDNGMLQAGLAQALQVQAVMAAQGALSLPQTGATAGTSAPAAADNKAADKPRSTGGLSHEDLLQLAAAATAGGGLGLHPMELRPGTPDTWALLRGSTPTPDAMGLHSFMGIPPLTGFPTDPSWLLHRGSPAFAHPTDANASAQPRPGQAQGQAAPPPASEGAAGALQHPVKEEAQAAGNTVSVAVDGGKKDGDQQQQQSQQAAEAAPAQPQQQQPGQETTPADASGAAGEATKAQASEKDGQAGDVAAVAGEKVVANPTASRALPPGSTMVGSLTGPSIAEVMDLVDRKASLGALGSAGDLAAAVAACGGGPEDAYFNVEDMLRSSTPALR